MDRRDLEQRIIKYSRDLQEFAKEFAICSNAIKGAPIEVVEMLAEIANRTDSLHSEIADKYEK